MSNLITVPVTYTDITVPYTTHNISVTISNGISTGAGGAGTVTGPALSVANNFASFLNTTGQVIKDSGLNSASFWKTAGASNLLADTFIDGGFDLYFGGNTKLNNFVVFSNHIASLSSVDNIGGAQLQIGNPGTGAQLNFAGISSGLTGINSITVSGDTGGQAKMIGGHAGNVISVGAPHSAGTDGINMYTGVGTATRRVLIDENGVFKFLPAVAPVVGQVPTATNIDGTWTWQNSAGGWPLIGTGTLTGAVKMVGSPTNTIEFNFDNITNTVVAGQGILLSNNTAATNAVQKQNSPAASFLAHSWRIAGSTDRYGRVDQYLAGFGTAGAFALNFDYSTTGGVTPVTIFSITGDTGNGASTLTFKGANFTLGPDTGGSFPYTIHAGAITAALAINLPVVTSNDEFSVLGLAQTFTVTKTFATSTTGLMPLVIPHGVAPTGGSLVDGGFWTTTVGLFVRINGVTVGPLGAGGSAQPFSDATALMMDNVDNTKLWALQLSSITTLTTRTWTVPDFDGTFARSSGTNTFTGVQTFSAAPVFSVAFILPDGTTATTQSAGDNSTKVSTTAYVDNLTLPAFSTVSDGYTLSSGGAGRLLLGDNTWLADIATGNALLSGGVGVNPAYGKITSSHTDATIQVAGLSWLSASGATLTGANVITGTTTNTLKYVFNSLGTTITDGAGVWLANTTLSTSGNQQQSGYLTFEGQGFATTPVASQQTKWAIYNLPVQGAANPSSQFIFASSINASAYVTRATLSDAGVFSANTFANTSANATLNIKSQNNSNQVTAIQIFNNGTNFNATAGTQSQLGIGLTAESFAPTSGTGAFNSLLIRQTINQTGGANGQIIGVNNNPTITAAVNVIGFDHNPITPANITGNHYGFRSVPSAALGGVALSAPLHSWDIGGSFGANITSTSIDVTLNATHYTVKVDASGANRTITLPASAGITRRIYVIKKTDSTANTVTIDGNASETIDGATTKVINTQWAGYAIQSDGTNWIIIATF